MGVPVQYHVYEDSTRSSLAGLENAAKSSGRGDICGGLVVEGVREGVIQLYCVRCDVTVATLDAYGKDLPYDASE